MYGIVCFALVWLMLLCSAPAFAGTEVSGEINTNTTWTKAKSPYIVTGNIKVYKSGSVAPILTIEAGVEIRFKHGTSLSVGLYDTYPGALKAKGTKESPVKFTSNSESPAPGDWKGIIFEDGTADNLTVLEYCTVEYGGAENQNIYCSHSSPTVRNCVIRYSSGKGIYADNDSFPVISGNTISDNASYPLHLNPVAVKNG